MKLGIDGLSSTEITELMEVDTIVHTAMEARKPCNEWPN
jgi:hypothetical protein